MIEDLLRATAECFGMLKLPWALVGGLAVSVRAEPRFTRDIDIAVSVSGDSAAEAAILEFQHRGFLPTTIVEQDAVHRLATVRMYTKKDPQLELMVDLLFASSGIEPEVCEAAEALEVFPGLIIPVATASHLLALKILARDDRTRPQDAADIRQLLLDMGSPEIEDAREACRLIEARGFHRGRDLQQALDLALREFVGR